MNQLARPNTFEIDLTAISSNTALVRRHVGPEILFIAALKANAYGFGLREVADAVLSSGANAIAVADLSDAAELRQGGVTAPIVVYAGSQTTAVTVRAIEEMNVIATVTSRDQAAAYSALASSPISVYVKVDVGLERLGLQSDDASRSIQAMSRMPNLQIDGVYAHMHWPAAGSSAYLEWQFARFRRVLDELRQLNIDVAVRFVASSGVLVASTEMMLNAIDPGHLIYGLLPSGPQSIKLEVRPAFKSLKSELIHVRAVRRVEFADLAPFAVGDITRLGVIPIGSADGMSTVNCGQVIVRGRRAPILAVPSLEHTRIDLTQVPGARPGDEVVIVGRQNGEEISHDEVRHHQKFASEAALALQVRGSVQRVYKRAN